MTPLSRSVRTKTPHVAPQFHVHSSGWLIQKQYLRFVRQRFGDHHASLHAAGQIKDALVALVPQRQISQQLVQERRVGSTSEQRPTEFDGRQYRLE